MKTVKLTATRANAAITEGALGFKKTTSVSERTHYVTALTASDDIMVRQAFRTDCLLLKTLEACGASNINVNEWQPIFPKDCDGKEITEWKQVAWCNMLYDGIAPESWGGNPYMELITPNQIALTSDAVFAGNLWVCDPWNVLNKQDHRALGDELARRHAVQLRLDGFIGAEYHGFFLDPSCVGDKLMWVGGIGDDGMFVDETPDDDGEVECTVIAYAFNRLWGTTYFVHVDELGEFVPDLRFHNWTHMPVQYEWAIDLGLDIRPYLGTGIPCMEALTYAEYAVKLGVAVREFHESK